MSSPPQGESANIGALVKAVVFLALVVLAFAGVLRACSFAPTTPDVDRGALPRIDAAAVIADTTVPFPKRTPALPPDWISQSSDVAVVGGDRALRVGWVTPESRFLRLVQSSAPEAALVAAEGGVPAAQGAVEAGGRTWVVHEGVRGEAVWVTDADGVRLLVTGDAPPPRFTELAAATLAAPTVP